MGPAAVGLRSDANMHTGGLEHGPLNCAVLSAATNPMQQQWPPSGIRPSSPSHRYETVNSETDPQCCLQECRAAAQELQGQLEAAQRQADDMQVGRRVGTVNSNCLVAAMQMGAVSCACGSPEAGLPARRPCCCIWQRFNLPSVSCSTSLQSGRFQAQPWLDAALCCVGVLLCVGPGSQPPETALCLI